NANLDFILPLERRNEVLSFVKSGLQDLSISRNSLDWGIPVPNAPDHVMYVWVDALTNYLTALGFPDEKAPTWNFWPANLHIIGKDILRFHAVYWPAFLMSAGLPPPKRIFAHGFMLNKGEKMSKSIGNTVNPFNLIHEFGVDQTRYYFLREVTFGQDGNYSPDLIKSRINADLANDIGNLAQRSLSMIAKNCAAAVPEPTRLKPEDQAILDAADNVYQKAHQAMNQLAIKQYLDVVWEVVADANRYFAGEEPWIKFRTDPKRMHTILYTTAEVVRQVAILVQPVVPLGASKLLDLLAIPKNQRSFVALGSKGRLKSGTILPKPYGVFPRYIPSEERKD
ncbi:MAG: methionine--tRNA ligase, partial [Hyphomicrobiaceae bacterium]|nr:methionine--tRNA ligase [Hyphomicrobiaceae bacterium]